VKKLEVINPQIINTEASIAALVKKLEEFNPQIINHLQSTLNPKP
jgi:hypothetical protein